MADSTWHVLRYNTNYIRTVMAGGDGRSTPLVCRLTMPTYSRNIIISIIDFISMLLLVCDNTPMECPAPAGQGG